MCFAWISEQTAIISLDSINLSVFVTEGKECFLRGTNWVFKSVSNSFVLKRSNWGAQIHWLNSNTKRAKYTVFQQLPYHLKPEKDTNVSGCPKFPIYDNLLLRLLPPFTLVTAICSWRRSSSIHTMILQGESEVLRSNCFPLSLCPPQISYGLNWIRTAPPRWQTGNKLLEPWLSLEPLKLQFNQNNI